MDKLLQNAGDLPASARSAVESLMGHTLRDDQPVYIVALDAAKEPPAQQRREAWADLQEIMAEMQASVLQSGISPEELDRVIDEECEEVRYGKK
ncbi:MAG TPA: hypothetical protein VFE46_03205 [Pirellulales bacterium]|jgi:hypothetical protein|nr:hypothetical protein [Pirellulales bacterium]